LAIKNLVSSFFTFYLIFSHPVEAELFSLFARLYSSGLIVGKLSFDQLKFFLPNAEYVYLLSFPENEINQQNIFCTTFILFSWPEIFKGFHFSF